MNSFYHSLIFIYGGYFICTAIFSFLINALFLKFAKTLGIRNNTDTIIRWGSLSKPALGGISFYIIFLLSLASYSIFFEQSTILLNKQILGILAAGTLAFLMGLADDAYNTQPLLKLFAQIACGLILISTGTVISFFPAAYLNYILTIVWVVGIMNSVNMLDNMDAITSIVSISIILTVLSSLFINKDFSNVYILILIGTLSSLLGFLYFNWHPSKLYMGDTGSQFMGLFLAAIGIIYLWNPSPNHAFVPSKQLLIPLLAFSVTIIDTTVVVTNRLRKKQSPFIGGKDHTTHYLSYLGLNDKQVAYVVIGLSSISMLFCLLIMNITNWDFLDILLFGGYFLIILGVMFYITNAKKEKKNVSSEVSSYAKS